jgi:putative ABC transport system permease protein
MKDIPENLQIHADMLVSMSSAKQIYGQATSDSEWTNHNFLTYLLLKPNTNLKAFEQKITCFHEKISRSANA